jgi:hypothetical protein
MNRTLGLVLLIAGVVLLIYGAAASDSLTNGFSKLFTGSPSTKTITLIVSGVVLSVIGLFSLKGKD